jgi:hypothetical protein
MKKTVFFLATELRTILRLFILEGFILLCLLLIIFGGAVNQNSIFSEYFITIPYALHVSAPTGHLQIDYTLVNS